MPESNQNLDKAFATGEITDDMLSAGDEVSSDELMASLEGTETIVDTKEEDGSSKAGEENATELELNEETLAKSLEVKDDEELNDFNKKFETDFKDMAELKAMLNKDKVDDTDQLHQNDINDFNFLKDVIAYDDRKLLTEEKIGQAKQQGKDVSSQDVMDDILEEVDSLFDKEVASYAANQLRSSLEANVAKLSEKINTYTDSQKATKKEIEAKRDEEYMTALQDINKREDFFGLQLTKESLVDAYGKVKREDTISRIKNDPSLAIEVQLFLDNKELIAKKAGGKSYSDGINVMAERLQGKDVKTSSGSNNPLPGSAGEDSDLISSFVR